MCSLYVILGAFGAHGLQDSLNETQLNTYQTGLRYLIIQALGMILINFIASLRQYRVRWFNYLSLAGIVLFSFSLLLHATKDLLGIDSSLFAMLAPFGGISYALAWMNVAIKWIRS